MVNTTGAECPIEVRNLCKSFKIYKDKPHTLKDRILFHDRESYRLNQVLQGVSFICKRGEALGLIGHNGCGKSTTLKLLNRIIYPDSGEIVMRGKISSLIELGAGFHPDMTGRENIYINASIFGLHRKEIENRLESIIRFSELEEFIDNPVRTYSSGMYMRLAFAIAINVDADILLVDEILAVGDANFQRKCFDRLQALKDEGCTIVIVSHAMDQIRSICDKVIWLDKGQIVKMGDAEMVTQEYLLTMAQQKRRRDLMEAGIDPDSDPLLKYPPQTLTPQVNHYVARSGNMQVRFRNIDICKDPETPCLSFHYGDRLYIRYRLESDIDDENAQIIFNLFSMSGVLCATFDSNSVEGFRAPIHAENAYWVIDALTFANGRYILDAIIRDARGLDCDVLGHLIEFDVQTDPRLGTGIVAMQNHWGLESE